MQEDFQELESVVGCRFLLGFPDRPRIMQYETTMYTW